MIDVARLRDNRVSSVAPHRGSPSSARTARVSTDERDVAAVCPMSWDRNSEARGRDVRDDSCGAQQPQPVAWGAVCASLRRTTLPRP